MDEIYILLPAALIIGGAVAGTFAGLLGIGGSILLVPLQFYLLTQIGYPPDIALKVSIATGLFFTFPTSFGSAYSHSKQKGTVLWNKAALMGFFGFSFSFLGAYIASFLNAAYLSIIFGIVVLSASLKFMSARPKDTDSEMSQNPLLFAFCGAAMGLLAGLTGIGGGLILIPLITFLVKMPIRQAVGTSSATIIFTAFGGVLSYIINGIGTAGLPPYSFGYINLPMWIALVIPGVLMAATSAKLSHRLNPKYVRMLFSLITLFVGIGMIFKGFFLWTS